MAKYGRVYRVPLRLGLSLLLLPALLICSLLPGGCSRGGSRPEEAVERFYASWGEQDYAEMYRLLDSGSQGNYPEESFVERYTDISAGIGLQAVALKGIERVEREGDSADRLTLSLSAELETAAVGEIPLRYEVELSRERKGAPWQLRWHPGLIFPELDDHSRVDLAYTEPVRGTIHDCKGRILAGPRVFKEVGAVPGVYRDENSFVQAVGSLLGLSGDLLRGKLHQAWVREGLYVPLTVLAPEQEALQGSLLQIPGVMINEVRRRYYPAGPTAAHLTGYLGEITAEELAARQDQGYRAGDLLGKTGLEAALEQRLAGRRGCTLRILDAAGGETALIASRELQNGEDITLTIDLDVQRCAAAALGDRKGAVVALDPRNGDVLALCSSPSFDPNHFLAGLSAAEWQTLQQSEARPLFDRALSGSYPPGSVFKPFTAAAALAGGALDPEERLAISGDRWQPSPSWGGYFVRRVHSEVERLNLDEAMKFSDNIYFARAGLALGGEKFAQFGERFGFGEQIPFLLPAARSRLYREGISSEIQLADSSFGQGEIMVTPLQMALLYSAFAGGGNIPQPRLLLTEEPAVWKEEAVSAAVAGRVHRALVEALHGPGAISAAGIIPGFRAAGKTGTAEVESSGGNACWYITYGPAESPGLVVAAVTEEGTWAATEALPVGRAVLEFYLRSGGS